jgi:hypothetical protein
MGAATPNTLEDFLGKKVIPENPATSCIFGIIPNKLPSTCGLTPGVRALVWHCFGGYRYIMECKLRGVVI